VTAADAALDGIRVQCRMLISHPPEQRFDSNGAELLQVRGQVLDRLPGTYPELVVRFGGQRRNELYKWARHGKHLGVDGFLQVKHWTSNGRPRVALLIDAQNLFPLGDLEQDLSKAGIYNAKGRTPAGATSAPAPTTKASRADKMRELLERADA
jgi:hypothetical protein